MPRVLYLGSFTEQASAIWPDCRWPHSVPNHIGFGIAFMAQRGYDVGFPPATQRRLLWRIDKAIARHGRTSPFGQLAVQRAAHSVLDSYDLVFNAPAGPCFGLVLECLRALGVLKTPIVTVAHNPPQHTHRWLPRPVLRWALKGCDAVPCLSTVAAEAIAATPGLAGKAMLTPLGPDARFYPPPIEPGTGIITAGKSARDLVTLGRAASDTGVPVRIVCPQSAVTPELTGFADNVEIISPPRGFFGYLQLADMFASARAIAIPLLRTDRLYGLWSLLDALGAGKPVIITRNPLRELDVEAAGIGRLVEPGDVDGWRAALEFFHSEPEAAMTMGRRARALVDGGLNSETFANSMMDIFDSVLGIDTRAGTPTT